jgi:hypothetical protein
VKTGQIKDHTFCSIESAFPSFRLAMRLLRLLLATNAAQAFCSYPTSPSLVNSQFIGKINTATNPNPLFQSQKVLLTKSSIPSSLLTLRGGGTDELVGAAYDWCMNLGGPAALVAGAVIATLYENVRGGALEVRKGDSKYASFAKRLTSILLLSAFGFLVVSIFVTTVTGTMLLSRDFSNLKVTATSTLGFLEEHFEFEYLTSRLCFLQGLLNWLASVALEHTIPRKGEGKAAIRMNRFVATSLATLIICLFSFYNAHLTFYQNYFHMCSRWFHVSAKRYFGQWPPRPMMFLYLPGCIMSVYTGIRALIPDTDENAKSDS